MPIMRHLALRYPGDPRAAAREDEFLFGPDLLAAPVLEPGAAAASALPAAPGAGSTSGARSRYRVGRRRAAAAPAQGCCAAGAAATLPAPLDELPLLARAGALLPLLPADVDTLVPFPGEAGGRRRPSRRPARHARAAARSRAGGARAGSSTAARLRSIEGDGCWQLRISDTRPRRWRLQAGLGSLRAPFRPCRVSLEGRPLPGRVWSFRRRGSVLRVGFQAPDRRTSLTVRACN